MNIKSNHNYLINSESEMLNFGYYFAHKLVKGDIIFFEGTLGTGKTTLIKGILSGLGYSGNVTSPTYTLLQNYQLNDYEVAHFDLYRLADPEELEWIGIRDLFNAHNIALVEWANKGEGHLPSPVYIIDLYYNGKKRNLVLRQNN
jgi:tRNA threonylcarbamoyladenosine biosynthesis protein TsaE